METLLTVLTFVAVLGGLLCTLLVLLAFLVCVGVGLAEKRQAEVDHHSAAVLADHERRRSQGGYPCADVHVSAMRPPPRSAPPGGGR